MNPGDRPRKVLSTLLGGAVAVAAIATLVVVADSDPAAAGDLERFASCEALEAWGQGGGAEGSAPQMVPSEEDGGGSAGRDAAGFDGDVTSAPALDAASPEAPPSSGEAPTAASRSSAELAETGGTGSGAATTVADGTNVVVEGVDELDVVDRLDADHVLVTAASRLSIVDVQRHRIVANLPVASSVQVTYDADNGVAWVVGPDDERGALTVRRVAVTPTSLVAEASWATKGRLVDARRVGSRLHLVATDGFGPRAFGGPAVDVAVGMEDGRSVEDVEPSPIPFGGGPVPCDQVLHPTVPSEPSATLLVTLPATGALEPEHATQVVGSGDLVHVTTDAAYLAMPLYGERVETGIHRFDLRDLELTGSGRVEGSVTGQFSMSDFEGHLRVAVTDGGGRFGPVRPMVVDDAVASGRAIFETDRGAALNQVVVLDTDGPLDVVGRTPKFGHPGETLRGVRFVGAIGYAVTFLETDPFYVLDLASPSDPQVVGEVELPGFSSYLHPIADGLVAGFGPDGAGAIAVKLFDVSDRTKPTVVDSLELGEESAIAWDHHAFVDLGEGRFAVPASRYRELRPAGCTVERQVALQAEERRLSEEMGAIWSRSEVARDGRIAPDDQARSDQLQAELNRIYTEGCLYPSAVPESSVVIVDASSGKLQLVQRLGAVRSSDSASRAVPVEGGWALLAGNRWFVLDGGSGAEVADLELGPEPSAMPMPVDLGGGIGGGIGGSAREGFVVD